MNAIIETGKVVHPYFDVQACKYDNLCNLRGLLLYKFIFLDD